MQNLDSCLQDHKCMHVYNVAFWLHFLMLHFIVICQLYSKLIITDFLNAKKEKKMVCSPDAV